MRGGAYGRDGKRRVRSALLLLFGVVSSLAALGVITSPWHLHPPLSGSFSFWLSHVLPLLCGGAVTVAQRLPASSVCFPILFSSIFALPFVGVSCLRVSGAQRMRVLGPVAAASLIALSVLELLVGRPVVLADGWGWRASLYVAGTVVSGILLLAMGWLRDEDRTRRLSVPGTLRLILGVTGVCILSYVLLPMGFLLLVGVYVLLGVCYIQELRLAIGK